MNSSTHQVHHHHAGESTVAEHRIRERAYEIYVQRGCKGGHADGDWLTAEAELRELEQKAQQMLAALDSLTGKA